VNQEEKQLNGDITGLASHAGDENLMTIKQDVNKFTECAMLAEMTLLRYTGLG